MANLVKRQIAILVDCEHLVDSPVFGAITDEMIAERLKEQLTVMLVETDIYPEEGDVFKLSNPSVIMTQEHLDTVCLTPDDKK